MIMYDVYKRGMSGGVTFVNDSSDRDKQERLIDKYRLFDNDSYYFIVERVQDDSE